MSGYLIKTVTVTTTPQVVVTVDADIDRMVYLTVSGSAPVIGFNATDGAALVMGANNVFVLPAGQEIHAWVNSSSLTLGVVVTKIVE